MQTDAIQPVEEAHVEAIGLNNAIEEAKEFGGTIQGQEAVADAKREASGTQEAYKAEMAEKAAVFKADWEREHLELQAKTEANDRKLLDGLLEIISSVPGIEKTDTVATEPVVSGQPVEVAKEGIPVPADQMPAGSEAQAALNATMMGAASEAVAGSGVIEPVVPVEPVAETPVVAPEVPLV